MLRAHKIALDPNNVQATHLARACGVARFAYNWALAEWTRQYEAWKADNSLPRPNQMALRRQLNAIKRSEFPWMLEVTKCAPQLAIMQLGEAFRNFFALRAKYPKFRRKGIHDRFSISNDQFQIESRRIRIPNLGWVRMREELRFRGKIVSATISRVADRWFASICVSVSDTDHAASLNLRSIPQAESQGAVGVDLGVSALATLSTGEIIPGPKVLSRLLPRLRRLSRSVARKQKGSATRRKARLKLARYYARIANIRTDALHKLTTDLTRRFELIGIEDLNVKGMLSNRHLSRWVSDMGFFEFRRQLDYKARDTGSLVVMADRWFASSKTCSYCGWKLEELPLSVRSWTCPNCGVEHERDVNAAKNLKEYAVSFTVSACGEEGSDQERKFLVKPASVKQEVSTKDTYEYI